MTDANHYRFLSAPSATVQIRLSVSTRGEPEVQIFGNRAGLLSLANVLLWLVANAWRREFLSLADLPFVHVEAPLAVCIRLTCTEPTGRDGSVSLLDHGAQYEWEVSEDDLKRIAVGIHRLVCDPEHEYDYLYMADGSVAQIHIRMTDAGQWFPSAPREPDAPADQPPE
jgi:hypothetical protein